MRLQAWLARDLLRILFLIGALVGVLFLTRDCGKVTSDFFRTLDPSSDAGPTRTR